VTETGLRSPGRVPGTREFVIPKTAYIVPYRVRGTKIESMRLRMLSFGTNLLTNTTAITRDFAILTMTSNGSPHIGGSGKMGQKSIGRMCLRRSWA
jgi:hypothetical protein